MLLDNIHLMHRFQMTVCTHAFVFQQGYLDSPLTSIIPGVRGHKLSQLKTYKHGEHIQGILFFGYCGMQQKTITKISRLLYHPYALLN